MGFGVLRASLALMQESLDAVYAADTVLDGLRKVLMVPDAFTVAQGPFIEASDHDMIVWVLRADAIPTLPDTERLPTLTPVYVRSVESDDHAYITLDRIEVWANGNRLTQIPCGASRAALVPHGVRATVAIGAE